MKTSTERFMEKVEMIPISGCWLWTGALIKSTGYGRFGIGKRKVEYAHRASWNLFNGEIPKGMFICHHCDTPACVNPNHLFIGSAKDNAQDALKKSRTVMPTTEQRLRAEDQPMAKLTNEQVRFIRSSSEAANILAATYGVHPSSISNARLYKTYRSVV